MLEPVPRLPQTEDEKTAIAGYLAHRMKGVEKAIETLRLAGMLPGADPAIANMEYYKHVRAYLRQTIYQLENTRVQVARTELPAE